MGLSRSSRLLAIVALVVALLCGYKRFFQSTSAPRYSIEAKYFGRTIPVSTDQEDVTIRPFRILFDRSQVDDVVDRLRHARFSDSPMFVDNRHVNRSTYGFDRQTAESVRQYWIETFDWKKTVHELNQFDHYKTSIAGLEIHFVRVTHNSMSTENKEAILFLHGWPGSFLEYLDAARLLNASTTSSYDLIIPSLPGFGYSDSPLRPGMTPAQMARLMHILMQRLGHRAYVVCGSDWGSFVGTHMAQLYPGHVRGFLSTLIEPGLSPSGALRLLLGHFISSSFVLDADEQTFLPNGFNPMEKLKFFWNEGGYFHVQATKPDTIGFALHDSPLGLATYILEKWSRWSNNETEVDQSGNSGLDRFTLDQLLSNVMLYWTTGTITSSMRSYLELMNSFFSDEESQLADGPVSDKVPVAIVNHRHEIAYTPRRIAQEKYPNIKLWLFREQGGHFAAMERPQDYSRDVQRFLLELEHI